MSDINVDVKYLATLIHDPSEDVLRAPEIRFGRGGNQKHPPNVWLRDNARAFAPLYPETDSPGPKRSFAEACIKAMRLRVADVKFVQKDKTDGTWRDAPHSKCVDKVQRLLCQHKREYSDMLDFSEGSDPDEGVMFDPDFLTDGMMLDLEEIMAGCNYFSEED